ncbi:MULTISPECIES: alpha/beta hydrolase [Cryobacterium]|uniref:Alpha/beta hydrolase n=1 Tax=Cryobacterium breve TaxID=1259258 RepID=A0ABY2J4C6_9MICO|nr:MULTISPECIES: alpha/beta hydrolase [Cryobacterium]TFC94209.1 alpha/beta hydrolase [Cryobacterium sp. TmT3-12]TFC98581.1 alpha/beta hydrolase [Cryobacterium breve]
MNTGPGHPRFGSRRIRSLAIAGTVGVAVGATALLGGFRPQLYSVTPDAPGDQLSELVTTQIVGIRTFERPEGVTVVEDIEYGTQPDGAVLTLDVCSPTVAVPEGGMQAEPPLAVAAPTATPSDGPAPDAAAEPETPEEGLEDETLPEEATQVAPLRPAVISIHGGSWARGDKGNSDWRAVCTWLASEGFVAYSVNYRLVPDAVFPAALDDVALAVEWARDAANAQTYGIDPDRIGVFGGSAGGNLAALLGARGSGSLTEGARVAAVAELSAPLDLSYHALVTGGASAGLQKIALDFADCLTLSDCARARAASPASTLDSSDPPVFLGTSTEEYIPLAQATGYAAALKRKGIDHELVTVPGTLHSIGILDATMRTRVSAFLHAALGE